MAACVLQYDSTIGRFVRSVPTPIPSSTMDNEAEITGERLIAHLDRLSAETVAKTELVERFSARIGKLEGGHEEIAGRLDRLDGRLARVEEGTGEVRAYFATERERISLADEKLLQRAADLDVREAELKKREAAAGDRFVVWIQQQGARALPSLILIAVWVMYLLARKWLGDDVPAPSLLGVP